jgi:hypothetical protein
MFARKGREWSFFSIFFSIFFFTLEKENNNENIRKFSLFAK